MLQKLSESSTRNGRDQRVLIFNESVIIIPPDKRRVVWHPSIVLMSFVSCDQWWRFDNSQLAIYMVTHDTAISHIQDKQTSLHILWSYKYSSNWFLIRTHSRSWSAVLRGGYRDRLLVSFPCFIVSLCPMLRINKLASIPGVVSPNTARYPALGGLDINLDRNSTADLGY